MLPGKKYTPADIVGILKRRAPLLAVPPIVALFLALVYSASIPNLYQSDILIAIVPQRVPDSYVRTTVTLKTEDRLEAITTQVQSRTVLEQLVLEHDLYPAERRRLPMEDVVEIMRKNIDVALETPRRGPRGFEPPHAFHVRFTYTDPVVAARITQRLGSLFVDQNTRDRGALAQATNQFLESELAEARQRLETQERRVEEFRERHGHELPTQMQSNLQVVQSTQLQIQALVEAIARDRDRKLMLERLYNEAIAEPATVRQPAGGGQAAPAAAADPSALPGATAQQQLAAARAALQRLELRLKPDHPDVLRAKRVIAELEPKAAAEAEQGRAAADATATAAAGVITPEEAQRREQLRAMKAEIESLDRQTQFKESEERRLRAQVGEYQRRIEAVPGVESQWAVLTRDYDTQQTAYKELLAKSEASKVALQLEQRQIGEHFRVLDPAGVPTRPVSPVRIQISAIGFGVGLVIAFLGAALLEFRDSSFRSEADVLDVLRLPVLAMVPLVETAAEKAQRQKRRMVGWACAAVCVVGAAYVFWAMRLWTYVA